MRTLKTWLRWLWKRFRTGQTPESLFFLFENTMSESGLATKSGLGARARDNGKVLVQLLLPSGELLAAAARVEAWPPSLTKTASEAVQHLRAEKYM
jgi:hypothetical protein